MAGVQRKLGARVYAAVVALALLTGVAVFWPTLELGLVSDDYVAVAIVSGDFAAPRHPLDAFDFGLGTPADVAAVKRLGSLPWWSPEDFRVAFLRPLSSALWHVDKALFGANLVAYHAHSIAIWSVLVLCTAALYRRLLPLPVAALATAIFALDQSQQAPVLWLCNRGALYAVLFGVLALWGHWTWREHARPWAAWLSALAAAVALLFGEWSLPMFAYVAAYELCRLREPLGRRVLAMLPIATLALVFLIVRALLGYGAHGSGIYVDPIAEPARFALLLCTRIPVFAADMLANIPAQWWDQGTPWRDRILGLGLIPPRVWVELPGWHVFHTVIGLVALAAVSTLLRASLREAQPPERRTLGWLALGALLALVPVAGSFPSTRLTLGAMFGVAPVLAHALRLLLSMLLARARGGLPRFLAVWVVLLWLGYAQLVEPARARVQADVDGLSNAREWVLSAELDVRSVSQQRVIMLASSEFITTYFWAYTWHYHGRPMPRSYYPLSTAPVPHDLTRVDARTLRLRPLGAALLESAGEEMFRAPELTFAPGQRVQLPGMEVLIEETRNGKPTSVRLRFDDSLDGPAYVLLCSTAQGLTRFVPPPVGQTVRVPAAASPGYQKLIAGREYARIGPLPDAIGYAPVPWFVGYRP